SSRVSSWLRKSLSSTQSSRIGREEISADGRGEAHRHDEVGELLPLALHDPGLQSVANLQADGVADRGREAVREVVRVERRRDVLALVLRLDRLDRLAEIRRR